MLSFKTRSLCSMAKFHVHEYVCVVWERGRELLCYEEEEDFILLAVKHSFLERKSFLSILLLKMRFELRTL
jgi:hypothetical protein